MNLETWEIYIEVFLLAYFGMINVVYTCFISISTIHIFGRYREIQEEDTSNILKSDSLPEVLFVIPMHNEEENVKANISNILLLSYRYKKIIVVNDGSEDKTLELLISEFDFAEIPKYYTEELKTQNVKKVYRSKKHPEVIMLDKEAGGKFDAVNAAINAVPTPFFVVLDADTFVDSDQFESLIRPMLTAPRTIGVGASIRIMNGCEIDYNRIKTAQFPKDFLSAMQSLEYLRAFCLRDGLDFINGNIVISGAFSIFPRDLIVRVGGFGPSVGEDMEIVVRLHRVMRECKLPYRIRYFSDPVTYTLVPDNLKELGNQRMRWHVGLMEVMWFHKKIFFNPRFKDMGMAGFPFWFCAEMLEPAMEVLGWTYVVVAFCLGTLNIPFFLMLFASTIVYTAIYTIFALCIEEFSYRKYPSFRSLKMLIFANFVENFGYRQLSIWWRLKGYWQFFKTRKKISEASAFVNDLVKKAHEKLGHKEE